MRISKFALLVLIPVSALILAACTGQASSTLSTVKEPATDPTCLAQTGGTTAADAEALINDKLLDHHDIDRIFNARHTREEWNTTLDRMIGYGANINDSEKQTIIDYLVCRQ
jgi:hypothetical protein